MTHAVNVNNTLFSATGDDGTGMRGKRSPDDFQQVKSYCQGLGLEVGCGRNRLSATVMAVDREEATDADLVWDVAARALPFQAKTFDFIFSAHCLKDIPEPRLTEVCFELTALLKPQGKLVVIMPDMEGIPDPHWREFAASWWTLDTARALAGRCHHAMTLIQCERLSAESCSLVMVLERLDDTLDEFQWVFTKYGRGLLVEVKGDTVRVMYADGGTQDLLTRDVTVAGECRNVDVFMAALHGRLRYGAHKTLTQAHEDGTMDRENHRFRQFQLRRVHDHE